ncbi:hypothetical protein Hanom_Chr01g00024261 [Helianthus anomalus]
MVVVDKPTLQGFWDVVVEKDTWDHELSKGRVSTILDLLHRYLHRLITSYITIRGKSKEWCTCEDLFFFYCFLYKSHALSYTIWHTTSHLHIMSRNAKSCTTASTTL